MLSLHACQAHQPDTHIRARSRLAQAAAASVERVSQLNHLSSVVSISPSVERAAQLNHLHLPLSEHPRLRQLGAALLAGVPGALCDDRALLLICRGRRFLCRHVRRAMCIILVSATSNGFLSMSHRTGVMPFPGAACLPVHDNFTRILYSCSSGQLLAL